MNTSLPLKEDFAQTETYHGTSNYSERKTRTSYEAGDPRYELGLWLQAVRSYFITRNHPFPESEQSSLLTRDWTNELRIAREALLRISQLTHLMVHLEGEQLLLTDQSGEDPNLNTELADDAEMDARVLSRKSFVDLAEDLGDICAICDSLLEAPRVGFYAWASVGRILTRELDRSRIAMTIVREAYNIAASKLPLPLLEHSQSIDITNDFFADVHVIIAGLARQLERLRLVDGWLKRDLPLKQTLPLFCLVNEESRQLLEFIDGQLHQASHFERPVFDALDGMNYAIAMELRKVFARELVGLASLRQAPAIYARVENAHGLLRDCFQQSIVAVAQLLDPTMAVARLFDTFQTRLDQSLMLRKDLWTVLQIVRRAEQEREKHPISRLLERLNSFREGSLRYLMYKDWEACERFMEEVAAARGAVEVTPVVHRFGAYLETLFGQVNMRSVLLDHAFDFSDVES